MMNDIQSMVIWRGGASRKTRRSVTRIIKHDHRHQNGRNNIIAQRRALFRIAPLHNGTPLSCVRAYFKTQTRK